MGDILRKTVSLSCIVQTLWDLCECRVIIEATVPLFVILEKNRCKLEQKHLLKMIKDVGLLMA